MLAGIHDQLGGLLLVDAAHFHQLVDGEIGQILARLHALARESLAQRVPRQFEEIAYVPASELNGIEEFDEEIVKELRTRSRDVLLTQAIASEESMDGAEPAADLLELTGEALGKTLARKGVKTREDLADLAVDELVEMGSIDEKKAAELIMDARKHWFAEEAKV